MSSNGSGKLKAKNKKTAKFNFFARKNLLITIGTNKPYTAINLQILPIQKTHKHNPKKKQNWIYIDGYSAIKNKYFPHS